MDFFQTIIVIIGLCIFETVSSLDNAIINANVLSTMKYWARRWFLVWGFVSAIFLVRGLLPWIIIWLTNFNIGPINSLIASFSTNQVVLESIRRSSPFLLAMGGTFLIFLFLDWIFSEKISTPDGKYVFFSAWRAIWTLGSLSAIVILVIYFSKGATWLISAVLAGTIIFMFAEIFKKNATVAHEKLISDDNYSNIKKIIYLEIIDAVFSVDSVLGAFAFTLSVPLIMVGNGLGVFIVRYFTVHNVKTIQKLKYLKDGAMFSVFFLGLLMITESFGIHIPFYLSPSVTIITVMIALYFSIKEQSTNKKKVIRNKLV